MNTSSRLALAVAISGLLFVPAAWAQYKSARGYFPQNNTVPGVTNPAAARAAAGKANAPGKSVGPKFQELPLNSQFYFLADTNRVYAWTKLTATTAKNSKNGVTATIKAETAVQK
jgi:hypothetical protein